MNAPQGSEAWLIDRAGCATASCFDAVIAKGKDGKPSTVRENYIYQLAVERLTGQPSETFISASMQAGTEMEPYARAAFELATGLDVVEVGFLRLKEWCGASPDGLIGTDAGLELKCPTQKVHAKTLLSGKMPAEHVPQVQGNLLVSGRQRWHFCSYNRTFPTHLRLFHCVIERDPTYILTLEAELEKFLADVAAAVDKLNALKAAA